MADTHYKRRRSFQMDVWTNRSLYQEFYRRQASGFVGEVVEVPISNQRRAIKR